MSRAETIGKKCYEVFSGVFCRTAKCTLEKIIKGVEKLESEVEKQRNDGLKIACIRVAKPLKDINGKLVGIIEDFRDVRGNHEIVAALRRSEEMLREQKIVLEKKNTALKEILEHIEGEKQELKKKVIANVDKFLLPGLKRIEQRSHPEDKKYVKMLENNLKKLTSSLGMKIIIENIGFTPREMEICDMIRNGYKSKDISRILNISLRTAETHRTNIRKKLGIDNKEINMTVYLQRF